MNTLHKTLASGLHGLGLGAFAFAFTTNVALSFLVVLGASAASWVIISNE